MVQHCPPPKVEVIVKPFLNVHLGPIFVDIGWYRGEPFRLFGVEFCVYEPDLFFVVIGVQVAKFCFVLGIER